MGFYQRQAGADDIQWVDVATCDPGLLAPQLDRDRALARLHVRREDGELVDGTAAFAAIWRALPSLTKSDSRLAAASGGGRIACGTG
jgi:predicted DCC family thiol-disulfide oxidoreductase YuxK